MNILVGSFNCLEKAEKTSLCLSFAISNVLSKLGFINIIKILKLGGWSLKTQSCGQCYKCPKTKRNNARNGPWSVASNVTSKKSPNVYKSCPK